MLRRALSALLLVGLAAAGAASAGLLSDARLAQQTASSLAASPCATTAAATAPATSSASSTTASGSGTTVAAPGGHEASAGLGASPSTTASGEASRGAATSPAPTTACAAPTVPTVTTVTTATAPTAPTVTTDAGPSPGAAMLVLTGHGWGHGMGMSQWGAYGYSEHGWTAPQILLHYYPGTTLGARAAPTVRVLVSGPDARVRLGSAAPWRVVEAGGTALWLPAGSFVLGPSLRVAGHRLSSPLRFSPGSAPVEVGGKPYHGGLLVVSNGTRLQVVNTVGMEPYLDGVVGQEMPAFWPAAALEAQAIAARSYALFHLEDVVTASPFDLYSDTRSQVYGGIDAESPAVSAAVRATAHQVVLYDGNVAMTAYSASSGGETVSSAEAVGTPMPYLVSVTDPYDTLSPYHDWGPVVISAAAAGSALGLGGPLVGLQTVSGPSRHVETATAVGMTSELTLSGSQVEADLGLRSTWFEVGWLALTPPPAPVRFGGAAAIGGVARGLAGVWLEARTPGSDWRLLGAVLPQAGGGFSVIVRPRRTTSYRLAAGPIRAAEITVPVTASVSAALGAGGVEGTVKPLMAGTSVTLERRNGATWSVVARTTTAEGGGFAIAAALAPGTYRVRCDPGGGLAAGYSPLLSAPGRISAPRTST